MMPDEEIYNIFKLIRWSANDGEPICPHCGTTFEIEIEIPGYITINMFQQKIKHDGYIPKSALT